MKELIQTWLGIARIDKNEEEMASQLFSAHSKIQKVNEDLNALLRYLKLTRKQVWKDDKRFTPPQPRLISSKFIKIKK